MSFLITEDRHGSMLPWRWLETFHKHARHINASMTNNILSVLSLQIFKYSSAMLWALSFNSYYLSSNLVSFTVFISPSYFMVDDAILEYILKKKKLK